MPILMPTPLPVCATSGLPRNDGTLRCGYCDVQGARSAKAPEVYADPSVASDVIMLADLLLRVLDGADARLFPNPRPKD